MFIIKEEINEERTDLYGTLHHIACIISNDSMGKCFIQQFVTRIPILKIMEPICDC